MLNLAPSGDVDMAKTVKPGTRLPKGYKPSATEPFMNARQREYFRRKLEAWKKDIANETRGTIEYLRGETASHPDMADAAAANADRQLELRARDRQRKLVAKIDKALARIRNRTYGYCEETGDPIGIARLEARPIATLSIEAQEMHEQAEHARA